MLELLAMTGKKYDPDPTDVQGQVFFTATTGTRGAVRIIWGKGREFPSTGTKDV